MAYVKKIGNLPTSQITYTKNWTFIDLINPASETCTLNELRIYNVGGSSTTKVKIFRDTGTYYNFISEVSCNLVNGVNYIDVDINIQLNDLIGYYTSGVYDGSVGYASSGGSSVNQSGDITTNTLKTAWDSGSRIYSLGGGIWEKWYVKTTGNDSLDGSSWANAWKTINKAATTVSDGSTVHIGFGTYDAEPAANQIAPQNVGTSGIYYLPETATTGGGTGTVSVEQNT